MSVPNFILALDIGTSAARAIASYTWDDEGHWVTGGVIGSGGAVYEWLLKKLLFPNQTLSEDDLFRLADEFAGSVAPGAGDLLFIRAAIEGIAFSLLRVGRRPAPLLSTALSGVLHPHPSNAVFCQQSNRR